MYKPFSWPKKIFKKIFSVGRKISTGNCTYNADTNNKKPIVSGSWYRIILWHFEQVCAWDILCWKFSKWPINANIRRAFRIEFYNPINSKGWFNCGYLLRIQILHKKSHIYRFYHLRFRKELWKLYWFEKRKWHVTLQSNKIILLESLQQQSTPIQQQQYLNIVFYNVTSQIKFRSFNR